MHPDYLNNKLDALSKKFDLPKITPHGLRHTFVSALLNNGVDDLIVKSLVGHAETSEITRNVYGHVNPEVQKETVKHLEDYRQKQVEKKIVVTKLVTKIKKAPSK